MVKSVPYSKIILHKQGVGQFIRTASINKDNTNITLVFKKHEMNDVLKSLKVFTTSIEDKVNIDYDSNELSDQKNLVIDTEYFKLMNSARGSEITIITENDFKISGRLVSVIKNENRKQNDPPMINILTPKFNFVTYNVRDIKDIIFTDKNFQKILNRSLNKIKIDSNSMGETRAIRITIIPKNNESNVSIIYNKAVPVWKTTYRLTKSKDNKFTIESWAIIDNNTNSNWNNVDMTLISGSQISFINPVYKIRNKKRRIVKTPDITSLSSDPILEDELEYPQEQKNRSRKTVFESSSPNNTFSSAKVKARVNQKSVSVRYELKEKVKVNSLSSTTAPIFKGLIQGSKILVYNEIIHNMHPMNTLELKNTTGITLMSGACTVVDENNEWIGDVMITTLIKDQIKQFPFEFDQGIIISKDDGYKPTKEHEIVLQNGLIIKRRWTTFITNYTIKNESSEDKTLILEHEFINNFELFETEKPLSKTENFIRFQVNLKMKESKKFTVKERRLTSRSIGFKFISATDLNVWLKNGVIKKELYDQLKEVSEKSEEIRTIEKKIKNNKDSQNMLNDKQSTLRKNIRVLKESKKEQSFKDELLTELIDSTKLSKKLTNELETLKDEKFQKELELQKLFSKLFNLPKMSLKNKTNQNLQKLINSYMMVGGVIKKSNNEKKKMNLKNLTKEELIRIIEQNEEKLSKLLKKQSKLLSILTEDEFGESLDSELDDEYQESQIQLESQTNNLTLISTTELLKLKNDVEESLRQPIPNQLEKASLEKELKNINNEIKRRSQNLDMFEPESYLEFDVTSLNDEQLLEAYDDTVEDLNTSNNQENFSEKEANRDEILKEIRKRLEKDQNNKVLKNFKQ